MQELCRHIAAHGDKTLTLEALAVKSDLSPFHLQRRFKAVIGVTPREYQEACRLQSLKSGLKGSSSVTEAIYDAGFNSSSRVYARADSRLGMTPRQYSRAGAALEISYADAKTPLGRLMIGATDRGICCIQFGESSGALLALLEKEFPGANLAPMDKKYKKQFDAWIAQLNKYLHGDTARLQLPLDIRGTVFQMKVWKYLQQMPPGTTQSYAAVAKGIGRPAAARAVAKACASNRIAILIPCHRVIRGDGSISGYKWGVARKEKLLAMEGPGGK